MAKWPAVIYLFWGNWKVFNYARICDINCKLLLPHSSGQQIRLHILFRALIRRGGNNIIISKGCPLRACCTWTRSRRRRRAERNGPLMCMRRVDIRSGRERQPSNFGSSPGRPNYCFRGTHKEQQRAAAEHKLYSGPPGYSYIIKGPSDPATRCSRPDSQPHTRGNVICIHNFNRNFDPEKGRTRVAGRPNGCGRRQWSQLAITHRQDHG